MVKTYDPRLLLISLGSHIVTGYADGTFLNIEAHGDGVGKQVGADGETVRSIDPDETATLTMTLRWDSPTVAFAKQQYDKDRATSGGGMFPVLVKDMKGGLVFSAEDGWIDNSPSREFGKELSDREIIIETGKSKWVDNGYQG